MKSNNEETKKKFKNSTYNTETLMFDLSNYIKMNNHISGTYN